MSSTKNLNWTILMSIGLFMYATSSYSQTRVSGFVKDAKTLLPLPFVSIGIPDTRYGAISNGDGSFELNLPVNTAGQTLIFAYLGYEKLRIGGAQLKRENTIDVFLVEEAGNLEAVVISAEAEKTKRWKFGSAISGSSTVITDSIYSGSEFALLVKLTKNESPVFINELRFKVVNNTLGELKARPRVYEVDSKYGKPGKEITGSNQIVRSTMKNGWVRVTLDQPVMVSNDFYLSIEWLFDREDRTTIAKAYHEFKEDHPSLVAINHTIINGKKVPYEDFGDNLHVGWSVACTTQPASMTRHKAYMRYNSFGTWQLSTSIPAFQVFVSTKPGQPASDKEMQQNGENYSVLENSFLRMISYDLIDRARSETRVSQKYLEIAYDDKAITEITTKVENARLMINAFNRSPIPQKVTMQLSEVYNLDIKNHELTKTIKPGFSSMVNAKISNPAFTYHYQLSVESEAASTSPDIADTLKIIAPWPNTTAEREPTGGLAFKGSKGDSVQIGTNGSWVTHPLSKESNTWIGSQANNYCLLTQEGFLLIYEGFFDPLPQKRFQSEIEEGQPFALLSEEKFVIYGYRVLTNNRLQYVPVIFAD